MQQFLISPRTMAASLWHNRDLTKALIKREVVGRYRGSLLGLLWSFFNPVFMLTVYTFVFSYVFKARWNVGSESKTEFALVLFVGLFIFNFFAECINRAPTLIITNVNYVKKVVFPLETLAVISLGSAMFHMLVTLIVWFAFYCILFGLPQPTAALLPLVLLPLVLITLGLSWLLTSLGVYLRDVVQVVGILTTTLMFLSPIFYPISALPPAYQRLLFLNPLTTVIEQARDVLIWGKMPNWIYWTIYLGASFLVAWLGFAWFQKTRKGFADVL
ncbi:MAG: ABC transporter permease [Syntrophobacteraceae bacterium]